MAGAAVPDAGDIGDDAVTNAQQETNLENLAEALRRMPGVGEVATAATEITSGTISPSLGIVLVDSEGLSGPDNLDHIDPDEYLQGSIVLLVSASSGSRIVTLRNAQGGAGQLILNNASNFSLSNGFSWIALRLVTDVWIELDRSYGTDFAGFRSFIGLGSVATLANGAVNAATLQGLAAAAFLLVGGTAANSTLFSSLATTAFLRADLASLQTIAGSLRAASGRLEAAIASAGGTSILSLLANSIERTQLFFDGTAGHTTLRLLSSVGAVQAGIRLRPSLIPDYWDGAAWVPLFTLPAVPPWIDNVRWDKLDGTTNYTSAGHYLLQSVALPSSGGDRIFHIRAGIRGDQVGGSSPEFRANLYVGDNGDDTDTLIGQSAFVTAVGTADALIDDDFECPAGAFLTLVLDKDDGFSLNVRASVAGTYTVDKRTYLRAEQVG